MYVLDFKHTSNLCPHITQNITISHHPVVKSGALQTAYQPKAENIAPTLASSHTYLLIEALLLKPNWRENFQIRYQRSHRKRKCLGR